MPFEYIDLFIRYQNRTRTENKNKNGTTCQNNKTRGKEENKHKHKPKYIDQSSDFYSVGPRQKRPKKTMSKTKRVLLLLLY